MGASVLYAFLQQRVEIAQISPGLYCRTHFADDAASIYRIFQFIKNSAPA